MNRDEELKIAQEMQAVAEQMWIDDLEENPDSEFEFFDCDCCGQSKPLAGSIGYAENTRLCNECVLLAETGFALGRLKTISDLMAAMEDKKLESLCDFIRLDRVKQNN